MFNNLSNAKYFNIGPLSDIISTARRFTDSSRSGLPDQVRIFDYRSYYGFKKVSQINGGQLLIKLQFYAV